MKEIGGYLELERFQGAEYHEGLIAVNNARCALLYLLKVRNIKKIYIPYFLCDSVSSICEREGCKYEKYHIGKNFLPHFEKVLEDGEYIYIVNFYGQLDTHTIKLLKNKYERIILDNVHAFFEKPIPHIDTIYSCRKFFGVPDGGYVSTDAVDHITLAKDVSYARMQHILGRFESSASEFYTTFKENDLAFQKAPLCEMSDLTHNLLRGIDYTRAMNKRNENFAFLARALDAKNGILPTQPQGAYAYPFYVPGGMEIKRCLAQKKIFVATLWPNVLDMHGTLEKDFAENILPLPCDQRYGIQEMQFVVNEVLKCIN